MIEWSKEEMEKENVKRVLKIKKDFRKQYEKNIAACEEQIKEHKAIYGATLWSGSSGLPWFLSFDLDKVLDYAIEHTDWETHPDLARVEVINFGKQPRQKIVGYLYGQHSCDGYLHFFYQE